MKEKIKYVTSGLTFRVIFGTISIIFLFEFMVSAVGYQLFTESLTQEYQDAAFRTANTAAALIDADKIESYLNRGENDPEYRNILSHLDILCQKHLSMLFPWTQATTIIFILCSMSSMPTAQIRLGLWAMSVKPQTKNTAASTAIYMRAAGRRALSREQMH